MQTKRRIIVFDAPDLAVESGFWAGLLDGTVEADDDWHTVRVDGAPYLAVQLAPDHVAPAWPHGAPQQIHLDLHVENLQQAHEQAIALGARLVQAAEDLDADDVFQVYTDPAGHPFCLCVG